MPENILHLVKKKALLINIHWMSSSHHPLYSECRTLTTWCKGAV